MKNKRLLRFIAIFLLLNITLEISYPSVAYALTAGPSSPEFSKFQPVATSDMVNTFTGDFSYNLPVVEIPGPDGAGYALSLSYQNSVSPEDEASWVGFGWTLNPGSINRNTRGFPDDFDGQVIKRYNKTRPNWTVTGTNSASIEFLSKNEDKKTGRKPSVGNVGLSATVGFNNYTGYRFSTGLSGGYNPFANSNNSNFSGFVGVSIERDQSGNFAFNPNVSLSYSVGLYNKYTNKQKKADQKALDKAVKDGDCDEQAKLHIKIDDKIRNDKKIASSNASLSLSSLYGLFTFSGNSFNVSMTKSNKLMTSYSAGLMVPFGNLNIGSQFGFTGSVSYQTSFEREDYKMHGYMYNLNAPFDDRLGDSYLERGTSFEKRDKYLGIPFNNADVFSVSGEGIGGGFRYYPNSVGHFYPNKVENYAPIINLGWDLNLGGNVGVGVDMGAGFSRTSLKSWERAGNSGDYKFSNDGFFRFNGDLGGELAYSDSELYNGKILQNFIFPEINVNNGSMALDGQDKGRTSYVSYNKYGDVKNGKTFNKKHIYNQARDIKDNTIAEISIHNSGGMQYIYGQPVYTRNETNLNFGVETTDNIINRQLVYKGGIPLLSDNLDGDYNVNLGGSKTVIGDIKSPPVANSFLLTQIYSNDYVDLGAPGCSAEDFGSWTQFSYSKRYGNKIGWSNELECPRGINPSNNNAGGEWYRWRNPYNGLNYGQNSISDTKDDLGSVSTGQKEVHYLKSIETKTHIAFFVTNKSSVNRWKDELSKIDWSLFIDKIKNDSSIIACDNISLSKFDYGGISYSECIKNIINRCRTFDEKTNQYIYNWECLNEYFGSFFSQYLAGSCQDRKDGLGAKNLTNTNDPMSSDAGQKGNTQLEYLEKIVLFSKARMDKPLKVTHFAYDYSLVRNLPNNIDGNYPNPRTNDQSGKLTLKKVWFEYEGTVSTKTSPYEFTYKYKDKSAFPDYLRAKYPNFTITNQNFSDNAQNPDYDPHALDPWGNVQPYSKQRTNLNIPWHYQGNLPAQSDALGGWRSSLNSNTNHEYDPAAWHLKQIKLPSGGEILVEYEEKDYEYVQDRKAMTMVSLTSAPKDDYQDGEYFINLNDLGIDPNNAAEVQQQRQAIIDYFLRPNDNEKIKFKFLYKLLGDGIPNLGDCRSDYIDGYARMNGVDIVNNQIKIKLGRETVNQSSDNTRGTSPKQACWDFYTTQRIGRLEGTNCGDATDKVSSIASSVSAVFPLGAIQGVLSMVPTFSLYLPNKNDVGKKLNPSLSFLRIPMIKKKKGGGTRVKRLLMYDAGIETGDANLYGQEYFYEGGVATNEPAGSREENPLVTILARHSVGGFQNAVDKLMVGEDKEQVEGPLGESLLPSASIGYSRVIVENIHKGQTGTGYTIQEYYTAKDFPFDRNYLTKDYNQENADFSLKDKVIIESVSSTSLQNDLIEQKLPIPIDISTKGPISLGLGINMNNIFASQGYKFMINNMHGQNKKVSTFRGSYATHNDNDKNREVSSQQYEYYQPGEKLRMLKYVKSTKKYITYFALPGKEVDMSMDMRRVKDETLNLKVSLDFGIGLVAPFPPSFSMSLGLNYSESSISTHTISKVIRYPVVVKRITSLQEGIQSVTENLAFSGETGQCLVTRTFDGYHDIQKSVTQKHDGSIYSLTLPAFWYYPEMGQKAIDSDNQNLLSISAGSIVSYGEDGNPLKTIGQSNTLALPMIKNVSQAQVQTYAKDWFKRSNIKEQLKQEYNISNEQEKALNNVYRPLANYVFKSDVTSANALNGRIYKDGLISQINMFTAWDDVNEVSPDWLLGSMVTEYSPNGQPLEETNALDIPSAARFGYKNMVPSMVAANAKYTNIFFEDFENVNVSNTFNIFTNSFHSGKKSLKINNNGQLLISKIYNNERLRTNKLDFNKGGAIVKMWVNSAETNSLRIYLQENGQTYPCTPIVKIGNWTLIETNIPPDAFDNMILNQKFNVYIKSNSGMLDNILVDDVKFQPKNAQATCYVYDVATLKLLAQFDDQHFGMFFQYDAEGKLTRKMVETIKGISTVTESQYNTPKRR